MKVEISGWKKGFQTVSAIRLLMDYGIGLKESKEKIDLLLDGKIIHLELNIKDFQLFMGKMEELGGIVTSE